MSGHNDWWLRSMKVQIYIRLSMTQSVLPYIADQWLNIHPFKLIIPPSSLLPRRARFGSNSRRTLPIEYIKCQKDRRIEAKRSRHLRAVQVRSGRWHSRRTASWWRPARTTGRSGCGTPLRAWHKVHLMLIRKFKIYLFLFQADNSRQTGE